MLTAHSELNSLIVLTVKMIFPLKSDLAKILFEIRYRILVQFVPLYLTFVGVVDQEMPKII